MLKVFHLCVQMCSDVLSAWLNDVTQELEVFLLLYQSWNGSRIGDHLNFLRLPPRPHPQMYRVIKYTAIDLILKYYLGDLWGTLLIYPAWELLH